MTSFKSLFLCNHYVATLGGLYIGLDSDLQSQNSLGKIACLWAISQGMEEKIITIFKQFNR